MKNICFVNTTSFWGGGEKLHFEYAEHFKNKGYHVSMVCRHGGVLQQKCSSVGIPTYNLNIGNLSFLNPFKYLKLILFFKNTNVDTVFMSTSEDLKTAGIAAKLTGIPRIVYLRGLAVPIKAGVLNKFLFNKVITHPIANSLETKRTMLLYLKDSVNASKVHVIYHGIDFKPYDALLQDEAASKDRDTVIIGNAGRLTYQKGQTYLIDIAKILKNKGYKFQIHIAGEGELRTELETLIADHKLQEHVILKGFVKDMVGFMKSVDIFALSSIWEGFGYVLVEAMACGKPVVAFNITSNPEIINNDKTGFLIDYPDTQAYAEKLAVLIEDSSLRDTLGKYGRETAKAKFTLSERIDELERYLQ